MKIQMTATLHDLKYEANHLYDSAIRLLKTGEQIPHNVNEIIRYCYEKNTPVTFSRNEPAGSCLDASRKRVRRDGRTGIELCDEMKTLVCTFIDSEEKRHNVAVHCRGDRFIDFKKVKHFLPESIICKARISLLDEQSLWDMYYMRFGTVNPLLLDIRSQGQLLQIFDVGLLEGIRPYMMTNAGEHTWAMEFNVIKVIRAVNAHMVNSICK